MHVKHEAAVIPTVRCRGPASHPTDSSDDSIHLLLSKAMGSLAADRNATRLYVARAWAMLQHEDGLSKRCLRRLMSWEIERLQDYIDTHLDVSIRTPELATVVNLSVSHFTHACKNTFGMTPLEYVSSCRIESACQRMLTTDSSLTTIAIGLGFCDQSHFIRTFRRHVGITPQAWRRLSEKAQCETATARGLAATYMYSPTVRGAAAVTLRAIVRTNTNTMEK